MCIRDRLREHDIEISCFRLQPFKIGDTICMNRERLIPPPELDDFYLDMASPAAGGRTRGSRRKSDKPKLVAWSIESIDDVIVTSWKDALIKCMKQIHELGLSRDNFPMRTGDNEQDENISGRSPAKINEHFSIETHGSSDTIRGWIGSAIDKLEYKKDDIVVSVSLAIETRSGATHSIPIAT